MRGERHRCCCSLEQSHQICYKTVGNADFSGEGVIVRLNAMPAIAIVIAALGFSAPIVRAQEGPDRLLVLELEGNTRLVGTAWHAALSLERGTRQRVVLSYDAIREIRTDGKGGVVAVRTNGTRVEGRIADETIVVNTSWGKAHVPTAGLQRLRTERPDWAPPGPDDAIGAAVGSEYRHADFLKTADEHPLRLVVVTMRGSVVAGATPLRSLAIRRADGEPEDIPLGNVAGVSRVHGVAALQVTLTDKREMNGLADTPSVRLDTQFGQADIPLAQIQQIVPIHPGSWSKRQPVTVSNPGKDRLDYQVRLVIPRAAEMQPDFDDIRLAGPDGERLPYWIETADEEQAVVWVRVPRVRSGMTWLGLHYGNADARSAADGEATFLFFDDFSRGFDRRKWTGGEGDDSVTKVPATAPVPNGETIVENDGPLPSARLDPVKDQTLRVRSHGPKGTEGTDYVLSTVPLPNSVSLESRMKLVRKNRYVIGHTDLVRAPRRGLAGIEYNYYMQDHKTEDMRGVVRTANKDSFYPYPFEYGPKLPGYWQDTWFRQRLSYSGMSPGRNLVIGRDRGKGEETIVHAARQHAGPVYVQLHTWGAWRPGTHLMYVDWILVRRYQPGPLVVTVAPTDKAMRRETVFDDGLPEEDLPDAPPDAG